MSAIFGIYHLDGRPVDPGIPPLMSAALSHRGPDAKGLWSHGSVALGHQMLWNTPESLHEHQPLIVRGGDLVIVADARIDNRDELIHALELSQHTRSEIADSQLILGAYEKWGERCTEKLLGDFAFVIWDAQKHTLFCARDHFGCKPFYYFYSDKLFVFGSEIKSLLCVPGVPSRLNEVKVGDYLTQNFEDKEITFYQHIVRLPQASQMSVGSQAQPIRRYWTADPTKELRLASNQEYAEAFYDVFSTSVSCRVRSAFPVASTLSGGLDSSSVACTAAQILSRGNQPNLHTLSAIFPSLAAIDPRIDERPFIETVVNNRNIVPHYVHADRLTPFVERFWQEEEVIIGINLYLDNAFFQVSHQQDARVLLTGHDGDSVISHGYTRLAELARNFQWITLLSESTALARRNNAKLHSVLWRQGVRPWLQQFGMFRQRRNDKLEPAWGAEMAINPAFARRIGLAERIRSFAPSALDSNLTAREQHWAGLDSGLFSYSMELIDKIAAPYCVEPRHPFFDKRLVEFCLALPLAQKLQKGWSRAILRHAMAGRLPKEVQWRTSKGNLSANFGLGLLIKENRRLQDVLLGNVGHLEQYVSIPDLQQMYNRFLSRPLAAMHESITVSSTTLLALWLSHSGLTA